MRRNLVLSFAACGLIGALACEGSERSDAAHGGEFQDAGGEQRALEAAVDGAPAAAMSVAAPPARLMPWLPGDRVPLCEGDGMEMNSVVSLDEAEAAGFDPRAELAQVEGTHQFIVRWTDPTGTEPEPTTLTVTLHGTGRVHLQTWMEQAPERFADYPPCPVAWIRPEVTVRFSTADHVVTGTFISVLLTHDRPPSLPNEFSWDIGYPWWSVSGVGFFQADPAFEPTSQALDVTLNALHGDENLGERGELVLRRNGDWRWAIPPDGCPSLARPVDSASCDPWTKLAPPSKPHDSLNACCANIGELVTYGDPASDDAGVP